VFNLQGSEIIVILLIALVVLGPERLPDAIRRFMQTYNELKKMGGGFQSEIKAAFDEPMREMRDTAKMVRDAADPSKLMAEAEAEQRLRDDAATAVAAESAFAPPVLGEAMSSNGHEPGPASHHGVVDPGHDVIATPGSPPPAHFPESFAPTPTPPPPPPPPPSHATIAGTSTVGPDESNDTTAP